MSCHKSGTEGEDDDAALTSAAVNVLSYSALLDAQLRSTPLTAIAHATVAVPGSKAITKI